LLLTRNTCRFILERRAGLLRSGSAFILDFVTSCCRCVVYRFAVYLPLAGSRSALLHAACLPAACRCLDCVLYRCRLSITAVFSYYLPADRSARWMPACLHARSPLAVSLVPPACLPVCRYRFAAALPFSCCCLPHTSWNRTYFCLPAAWVSAITVLRITAVPLMLPACCLPASPAVLDTAVLRCCVLMNYLRWVPFTVAVCLPRWVPFCRFCLPFLRRSATSPPFLPDHAADCFLFSALSVCLLPSCLPFRFLLPPALLPAVLLGRFCSHLPPPPACTTPACHHRYRRCGPACHCGFTCHLPASAFYLRGCRFWVPPARVCLLVGYRHTVLPFSAFLPHCCLRSAYWFYILTFLDTFFCLPLTVFACLPLPLPAWVSPSACLLRFAPAL